MTAVHRNERKSIVTNLHIDRKLGVYLLSRFHECTSRTCRCMDDTWKSRMTTAKMIEVVRGINCALRQDNQRAPLFKL